MQRAIAKWLPSLDIAATIPADLAKHLHKTYAIYGCMLLLPPTAFSGPGGTSEWQSINHAFLAEEPVITKLYEHICRELKVTHIALNKPIPLHNDSVEDSEAEEFNLLRSPHHFQPLYTTPGNTFGPITTASPPTAQDFESAFWVTAKQNGIHQTWAPRWTMFSRGNISEKARLAKLPSVLQVVEEGECSAVDLYAGIGYFAFSYVKAGVSKVLCWDLNEWSCEGLRRGARANKWQTATFEGDLDWLAESEARLLVFNESNEAAPERIERVRSKLPPVRHVNCGMLPSSRDSLRLAASVLDHGYIGWVHVHENLLVEDIEQKAEETRKEFESLLRAQRGEVSTKVEFINRLKSYAPRVMHCVIDIVVYPKAPS